MSRLKYLAAGALFLLLPLAGCEDPDETGVCAFGGEIYQCTRDGGSVHCDWDGSNDE